MICFVFRVDGVWGVGQSLLCSVLGLVGGAPAQGWVGDTARRCRRGPRRHHRRPALRMRTSRGAGLFHQPPTRHIARSGNRSSGIDTLANCAGPARAPLLLLVHRSVSSTHAATCCQ